MNTVKIVKSGIEPESNNLWLKNGSLMSFVPSGWKDVADSAINLTSSNYLYVSKGGSDSNAGSVNAPMLTVQAAINNAVSGTVIFIFPGTYTENLILKSGVYLTCPIKFGVTILGNHVASFTGTIVIENIILNSTTGNTLSISGTTALNLQLIGGSIYSTDGDAINWSNTNSSSKLYIEDSTIVVSTSGSTARAFYSSSTTAGSIIANRTTFKLNNAANVCLSLNGAISFTHTSDQVYGQIVIGNSSSYVGQLVALTATGAACLTTNSTGTSVLFACTVTSNVTPITGAGVFLFSAISYGSTGVGGASTLNGGAGAIALPISAISIRQAALKATPQDGLLEYNGIDLYFTKGTTRYKITLTAV
jgi:hypothetical protein